LDKLHETENVSNVQADHDHIQANEQALRFRLAGQAIAAQAERAQTQKVSWVCLCKVPSVVATQLQLLVFAGRRQRQGRARQGHSLGVAVDLDGKYGKHNEEEELQGQQDAAGAAVRLCRRAALTVLGHNQMRLLQLK
jgi:hypothetical protein